MSHSSHAKPQFGPGDVEAVLDGWWDLPPDTGAQFVIGQWHKQLAVLCDDIGVHPLLRCLVLEDKPSSACSKAVCMLMQQEIAYSPAYGIEFGVLGKQRMSHTFVQLPSL